MDKITERKIEFSSLLAPIYLLEDKTIKDSFYDFITLYFVTESLYKKLLCKYKKRNNKTVETKNLKVKPSEVFMVLDYFNVEYDVATIKRIFGSNDSSFEDCSLRCLRNRLVHNITKNGIIAVLRRSDQIQKDLKYFLMILN